MKSAWLKVRSVLLWIVTLLHFFVAAPVLVFLAILRDLHQVAILHVGNVDDRFALALRSRVDEQLGDQRRIVE